jgi:PAP2 superfamily
LNAGAAQHSTASFGTIDPRELAWLKVLAILTAAETLWWALCWQAGIAPAARIGTYLAIAVASVLAAFALRSALRPRRRNAGWPVVLIATTLVGFGASLFLPLKYAIPMEVPFWLDMPLATGERHLFGTDAWRIADGLFGWALLPSDRVYGLWLPVQSLVLFSVILLPASRAKTHALIAYGLAWFLLGVVAAMLCASAGPIFYDRMFGGHYFAGLTERLGDRAWVVQGESDAMWSSFASGRPGLVAGISAMPSIHVAISFWIWLTTRRLAPRTAPLAVAYAVFVWIASVQLGWHYVSDGLAGLVGMLAVWWLAERIACDGISSFAAIQMKSDSLR